MSQSDYMAEYIEIDGVQYTEFQIKRALALEKVVLSPNFVPILLGKIDIDGNILDENSSLEEDSQ